jgi:hypothetical protein
VKRRFVRKGVLLLLFSILIIAPLTFASARDRIAIQGIVMELDLKKNVMIVNERAFFWDPQTTFYNEKGSPITADQLKAKTWVYIEGMTDNVKKRAIAEKIYLLPKYINEKEKHLYPFIQ